MWGWLRAFVRDIRQGMLSDDEYLKMTREAREANTEVFEGTDGPIKIIHSFTMPEARYYDLKGYES